MKVDYPFFDMLKTARYYYKDTFWLKPPYGALQIIQLFSVSQMAKIPHRAIVDRD
jgi:hypothetical protein